MHNHIQIVKSRNKIYQKNIIKSNNYYNNKKIIFNVQIGI